MARKLQEAGRFSRPLRAGHQRRSGDSPHLLPGDWLYPDTGPVLGYRASQLYDETQERGEHSKLSVYRRKR